MSPKNPPPPPPVSPYSILRSLRKHAVAIGVATIVGAVLTFAVVRLIPPIYSAEALVLVESQRIPENYVAATVHANLENRLNTLRQQILSYSRLAEVIQKYNLYQGERAALPMEAVVEIMRKDMNIAVQRGLIPGRPAAFGVTYRGGDPEVVAQVANLVASFFIDENLRTREVEAVGTSEFLDAQLGEARSRLEDQERQLSAYKLRHSGELPQQENALMSEIAQARTLLSGLQDNINRIQQNKMMAQTSLEGAEAQHAVFRQLVLENVPASGGAAAAGIVPPNVQPVPPRESERLEQELQALRARYAESHPDIRRAKAALARAQQQEAGLPSPPVPARTPPAGELAAPSAPVRAAAPPAGGPRAAESAQVSERIAALRGQIANWEREIQGLERERQKVLVDIASLQSRVSRLPLREQELASVTRDYENTRANYRSLLDKKLAADVAANMERRQKAERFVMLEMARRPERPIKPNRPVFYAGGTIVCLMLAMAGAIGAELKKGILLGEWELPQGVVVLGRVPPIHATRQAPVRPRYTRLIWTTGVVAVAACLLGTGVYSGWLKWS